MIGRFAKLPLVPSKIADTPLPHQREATANEMMEEEREIEREAVGCGRVCGKEPRDGESVETDSSGVSEVANVDNSCKCDPTLEQCVDYVDTQGDRFLSLPSPEPQKQGLRRDELSPDAQVYQNT